MNNADVLRAAVKVLGEHSMQRGPCAMLLLDMAKRIERDAGDGPVPATAGLFTRAEALAGDAWAAETITLPDGSVLPLTESTTVRFWGEAEVPAGTDPAWVVETLDDIISGEQMARPEAPAADWTVTLKPPF